MQGQGLVTLDGDRVTATPDLDRHLSDLPRPVTFRETRLRRLVKAKFPLTLPAVLKAAAVFARVLSETPQSTPVQLMKDVQDELSESGPRVSWEQTLKLVIDLVPLGTGPAATGTSPTAASAPVAGSEGALSAYVDRVRTYLAWAGEDVTTEQVTALLGGAGAMIPSTKVWDAAST
jgi:hypothetical protein